MANAQKAAFFEKYAPIAMEQQQKYGIPASVTLAQMYIESGGGTSKLAMEGNNYFGIKCSRDWLAAGKPYSLHSDDKPNEKFCNYSSVEESVLHHSQFLMGNRYAQCRQCSSDDYRGWATGLQSAGYATNRNYAAMLVKDIEEYGLQKYDQMAIQSATQPIGYARGEKVDIGGVPSMTATAPPEAFIAAGTYCYPVDGDMTVTSLYGHRHAPTAGSSTEHNGIDISVPTGTAVRATESGTVVAVKNDLTEHDSKAVRMEDGNKGGNYVVVEYPRADGSSYFISYCHLTEKGVKVNVGDKVNAGDVIAYSGATGNGTGPHLHMTVRTGPTGSTTNSEKSYVNPLDYLAEITVRGSLTANVTKNGKDLLAGRLTNVDITPTPHEVLLAQQSGKGLTDEQRDNAAQGAKLDGETGSNDPKNWLAYLMGQNNDYQQGGNLFSSLISGLFMSAMAMAMQLDHVSKDSSQVVAVAAQQPETNEEKNDTLIRRERESVDPDQARELAMRNFDVEYPEQQSQGLGQRIV
jgi:murein DD-endopeptidase MepM/ murein hydrolase activator NlpD